MRSSASAMRRFTVASDTSHAWLERFRAAGVPSAPINGYAEALADPQAEALGLVVPATLPGGHATRTVGCPIRLDGGAVAVNTTFPALGEHTAALRAQPKEQP